MLRKCLKSIFGTLHNFFFEEVSASGFGLMRIAWAFVVMIFLVGSYPDIVRYYSEAGLIPDDVGHLVFRSDHRYTLLNYITEPTAVVLLWWIFILCLLCMMVGLWPRVMTIVCVLLLFSFHERNLQPLGGGDTALRNIGFILLIAPEVSAFSLDRAAKQWKHWKTTNTFLPKLKTHIWPYRILLWQMLIIYVTSGWDKLQGTMWLDGTVVEAAFHHTHFFRYGKEVQDAMAWLSPFACFYTLIWEFLWLFLLIPKQLWYVLPERMKRHSLKRWILLGGVAFHWGIFIFMDVGSFPFAMSAGYIGLLLDDDFEAFKRMANRKWKGKIVVLYDGICGLCQRSVFWLMLMDRLDRLQIVSFRDQAAKKKYAANVSESDLDRAMHIKMPNGRYYKGFDAFRKMCWHLPVFKIFTPVFYVPGVPPIGRIIYGKIADSRDRCAHGACKM